MTVRFILGSNTTPTSEVVREEIKTMLKQEPYGKPIIFIVPEQMTFQQEYALLEDEIKGSIRAQVLSFSRLAFRVMEETGGATKSMITSTGIQMMLRKIIEERQTDWHMFQQSVDKKGFIEQLEVLITEFKRYKITPEQIDQAYNDSNQSDGLKDKLGDLHYIYSHLTEALTKRFIDGEDRLRLLEEKVLESQYLKDATIYIDGFHRFTPLEQAVLTKLMEHTKDITLTLTLPETKTDQIEPFDIFTQTKETLDDVMALAKESGQQVSLTHASQAKEVAPFIKHLDSAFDTRPIPSFQGPVDLKVAYGVHPRAEIEGVAQEILALIREENYRYRDVALMVRDEGLYHDLIRTIFEDYDIPVFIDEKEPMINHPLIELIRSLFDVVQTEWRYDSIFRLLKTGFFPVGDETVSFDDDAIDTLENYVLEYGIKGRKRWLSEEAFYYQRFRGFDKRVKTDEEIEIEEKINRYREHVVRFLQPIDKKLRQTSPVKEKIIALYEFLETIGVDITLEQWQETLEQQGEVKKARDQEQVWQEVMRLFDEVVEIIGDETIKTGTLKEVIETGLDSLTFQHVPPTLDHVIVGSIDHSRMSDVAVSFLVGVNEGTWPKRPNQDTVLTEEERHTLETQGFKLADSETEQLIDDWFYIYLAVTSPKEKLWLSYTLSDTEGKAKMPASLIKRMYQIFPETPEQLILQDPEEMMDPLRFVSTETKARQALTAQLAKFNRAYPIDDVWWSVFNWFVTTGQVNVLDAMKNSLYYKNLPTNLKQTTVDEIYQKKIKTSVSRMEQYYQCSYKHFAQHSLKLEERKTYKLDAPDIGQLFHEALKQITEWVQVEEKQFADLSEQEAGDYAKRVMERLSPVLQHQILHSSNRYQYMKQKLETVISRATFILSEQARRTRFSPIGLEVGFGLADSPLAPVRTTLSNGYELILRGRIDRVDQAKVDDQLYLRIIDYKSSKKSLDLVDVYYGLSLQMLAYLDVLLQNSEHWLGLKATPAGVLYFHVHDQLLSQPDIIPSDKLEQELFKLYKMQGLLIDDAHIVELMDTALESGSSPVVPFEIKKDGTLGSRSKTRSLEDFDQLQTYVREKITDAGLSISSGDVSLNPYQKQTQTACTYCPFKSVCQFDPSLDEHHYRILPDVDEDALFQSLRERGNR